MCVLINTFTPNHISINKDDGNVIYICLTP